MKSVIVLFSVVLCLKAFSHGDHSAPGAIPPSPNGGVLGEAKHDHHDSHDHNHKKAEEREVFYEVKYKGKLISIYPLELDPKTNNSFLPMKIKEFSKVKIEVKDPRKKKTVSKTFRTEEGRWTIDASKIRGRRLIIVLSGTYKGAKYKAKVQVEKK